MPAELRNRIYDFIDVQRSISRETRLDDLTETVTPDIALVSKQVRSEFLAVFLKGRTISVDMRYISMPLVQKWLQAFKNLPADKNRIGSFKILWSEGDVDDYSSGLPSHDYYDPELVGYSEHFEETLANICKAVCEAGLPSATVKHEVWKYARVAKQDRQNFERHAQDMFQKIELKRANEETTTTITQD